MWFSKKNILKILRNVIITLKGLLVDCRPVSNKGPIRKDGATSEQIDQNRVRKSETKSDVQKLKSEVRRIQKTEYQLEKKDFRRNLGYYITVIHWQQSGTWNSKMDTSQCFVQEIKIACLRNLCFKWLIIL
jgi:hypothetical protein